MSDTEKPEPPDEPARETSGVINWQNKRPAATLGELPEKMNQVAEFYRGTLAIPWPEDPETKE